MKTLLLPILILSALIPSAISAADADTNVLLIITDEHNFRTLGCYRDLLPREQAEMWGADVVVPTPHLDSLAADGVICTRAYATAPVCSPCRAAMITGRYPHATGVPTNDRVLDRTIPTLADRLNDAGYRTTFIGKWHLGGTGKPEWSPKVDGGFQFKEFMYNRGHWKKFEIVDGKPRVASRRNGNPNYDVGGADSQSFSTDWLTDRAIDYITDPDAKKPFFTVISYPDPHGPNTVRPPYDHRFDDLRFSPPRTYQTGIPSPKWLGAAKKHPVFRGEDMSRYFGMVQCIDDNIGRLLGRMKDAGRLDNTLIVMTSDHGDLCYEHDRQNKGNPYEGSARVPMLLRQPGRIVAKQVYQQPMGTVDVTPTVMGLLGLEANPDDQGRDLSGDLADVSKMDVDPASPPITFLRNAGTSARWVAAVDQRYKLILSVNDTPWLFDAEQDPDELLNFYRRPGTEGVAERLAKALQQYGIDNKDPHLEQENIAASLAAVLSGKAVKKKQTENTYQSQWQGSRLWIGPDWWANPLTDWSVRKDAVVASAAANRTLCLLPRDLSGDGKQFSARVQVSALEDVTPDKAISAGFRIGRRGGIDDYRHALVHATRSVDATIRSDGKLSLGNSVSEQTISLADGRVDLELTGKRTGDQTELALTASRGDQRVTVTQTVPTARVLGGFSLLSSGYNVPGGRKTKQRFAFRDFSLSGDLVKSHADRTFGPILWTQYTLSHGRLRLQAQLAPLGPRQDHRAELLVADTDGDPQWAVVGTQSMEKLSRTVTFTVDDWPSSTSKRYQVRFPWRGKTYTYDGVIRKEPAAADPLKLACFSCDNGYLFPIPAMVSQVTRQDPDMMFFAGDQIYENYGGFGVARSADTALAMIDYLRKYYQFGWTWRDLMRDRPTVILPDDHDVFQGNLWGHGGRKLPETGNPNDWNYGGYMMPGDWVRGIEQTQVGHLPDPAVDMQLPIGIRPYFTSMTYGGVGFAILEDRKFKTGPFSMPEAKRNRGDGAELLGKEQEEFLQQWASDWTAQEMKCALSQTIFCNASTHTGQELRRGRWYYDSGAWPIEARNRVVRILGECNALAIHGDQHLGVLLRHGIEDFDDAGYAFMVPGTANGFPRAWWPGVEKGQQPNPDHDYVGKFHDDAGHPLHVLAVGNPEPGSNQLPKSTDPMEIGYRKGSGYGIVLFDKQDRSAKIWLYRLGNQEETFRGFPKTIPLGGKP